MKLKLTNKTTNNLWIAEYCFIPGTTETENLSKEKVDQLKDFFENNDYIKSKIENEILIVEWLEEEKKPKRKVEKIEQQEGML